jgi:hypothetical protein
LATPPSFSGLPKRTSGSPTPPRAIPGRLARDSLSVAELRAAQQAYVAAGQGQDFWFARVSAIVKDLNGKLPR